MSNPQFTYKKFSGDDLEGISSSFCDEHGDSEHGIIPDAEYDRLFDDLGVILAKYGSYSGEGDDADFSGYRYVDQIPHICIVPNDDLCPAVATAAGLEGVGSAHRPLAVSFDYHPDYILILSPQVVYSTFGEDKLTKNGEQGSAHQSTTAL